MDEEIHENLYILLGYQYKKETHECATHLRIIQGLQNNHYSRDDQLNSKVLASNVNIGNLGQWFSGISTHQRHWWVC